MYCKYCGQEVKGGAKYCPRCGQEIKRKRREGGGGAFYLLLFLPVLPPMFSLMPVGGMLLINWSGVIRSVITAAVGIAGLLLLCQKGKIHPSRFHTADVLMWLLWLYFPSLMSVLKIRMMYYGLGQYAGVACSLLQTTDLWLGQLGGLWIWVELAVLCMVRSGSLRVTRKKAVLVLGVLVVWSVLLCAFRTPISYMMTEGIEEIISCYLMGFDLYFLLLWLRRGFELAFMAMYGGNRLKPGFGVLIPVILNLLIVILTPVMIFTLAMGTNGIGLTAAGAYLLSSLTLILMRAKKGDVEQV